MTPTRLMCAMLALALVAKERRDAAAVAARARRRDCMATVEEEGTRQRSEAQQSRADPPCGRVSARPDRRPLRTFHFCLAACRALPAAPRDSDQRWIECASTATTRAHLQRPAQHHTRRIACATTSPLLPPPLLLPLSRARWEFPRFTAGCRRSTRRSCSMSWRSAAWSWPAECARRWTQRGPTPTGSKSTTSTST